MQRAIGSYKDNPSRDMLLILAEYLEKTINEMKHVGKTAPDDLKGRYHLLLGVIYEKLGEKIDAEANYRKAKEKNIKKMDGVNCEKLPLYKGIMNVIEKPGKKKKYAPLYVAGGIALMVVLAYLLTKPKKKKEYTLTITKGTGVNGSPNSGLQRRKEGTIVNYAYSAKAGYSGPVVRLDGRKLPSSGSFKIKGDHHLTASAISNEIAFEVEPNKDIEIVETMTYDFTVKLSKQPQEDVEVTVSISGDSDITIRKGEKLKFTTSDYNIPQTVTLHAAADDDNDADEASVEITAAGIPKRTITVREVDQGFPFIVKKAGAEITNIKIPEGRRATFEVELSRQPQADVAVTVMRESGDENIFVESGGELTFTPANWNTPQAVTLKASPDYDIIDGEAIIRISGNGFKTTDITAIEVDKDSELSIDILDPKGYQTLSGTVTIETRVQGTNTIDRVDFYVDRELIGTRYSEPYEYKWDTSSYSADFHNIRVYVYDKSGNSADDQIVVSVSN